MAAGADESVQRVTTAVHRLDRRYDRQLADIDVSTGERAVLSELARSDEDTPLTWSHLARRTWRRRPGGTGRTGWWSAG